MDRILYKKVRDQLDFSKKRSTLYTHLLIDCCLVLLAAALFLKNNILAYAGIQILLAAFYFRSFSIMHDAVHGCVDKNKKINDLVGIIYGGFSFLPYTTWKEIHIEHHVWSGNFEKDPAMRIVIAFPKMSNSQKIFYSSVWRSWFPLIAFLQEVSFWTSSIKLILEKKLEKDKRTQLFFSILSPTIFFISILLVSHKIGNLLYFAPSFLTYLVMIEVINFPHHLNLPRFSGSDKLNLWEQHVVSRTCVYSKWFSKYILLNFNYHSEHHMFPQLPWPELEKAHHLLRQYTIPGYNLGIGHEWIKENRNKSLKDVFAPTEYTSLARRQEAA